LSDEIVVVFVCADPKPDDEIAVLLCNSAIMIADSHGPDIPNKWLELHRWMKRIAQPNLKLFSRETLNVSW
jgi:hypothetical protein